LQFSSENLYFGQYILCSTVARSYGRGVLAANLAACVRDRESERHLERLKCEFLSTASILQLSLILG